MLSFCQRRIQHFVFFSSKPSLSTLPQAEQRHISPLLQLPPTYCSSQTHSQPTTLTNNTRLLRVQHFVSGSQLGLGSNGSTGPAFVNRSLPPTGQRVQSLSRGLTFVNGSNLCQRVQINQIFQVFIIIRVFRNIRHVTK